MREMKDSGIEWIGDIPVSWDTIKLKFYGKIYNGSTPKSDNPEYYDGDITWVTPADMDNASTIINSKKTITEAGLESCGTNLVPKNSIVISTRAPIGIVCIAGKELCTNQGCKSIVPKDISCAKYPYYFLLTQSDTLNMLGKGTTFLELSTSDLSNYKIPFPAKKEQQAIADYLDGECARIDGIVTTQRQIIERLKEYKKSVITEAVTRGLNPDAPMKDSGIEWIGDIPAHWEVTKLKTNFAYEKGKNAALYTKEYVGLHKGSYPVYSGQTEDNGIMGTIDTFDYDLEECVFSTTVGAKVMTPMYLSGKFSLSQNCLIMKPIGTYLCKMLYYCLEPLFDYERKLIPSYMQPSLRFSDLNKYCLPQPPISEQQAIADYLDRECARIDTIIEKRERMIELMTEYKKSLIYECVTGKKEIVDVVE